MLPAAPCKAGTWRRAPTNWLSHLTEEPFSEPEPSDLRLQETSLALRGGPRVWLLLRSHIRWTSKLYNTRYLPASSVTGWPPARSSLAESKRFTQSRNICRPTPPTTSTGCSATMVLCLPLPRGQVGISREDFCPRAHIQRFTQPTTGGEADSDLSNHWFGVACSRAFRAARRPPRTSGMRYLTFNTIGITARSVRVEKYPC